MEHVPFTSQEHYDANSNEIMRRNKAFFAFSESQLAEGMAENGITDRDSLVSLGAGLIAPRENAKALLDELDALIQEGNRLELERHTPREILLREMANYELQYSYDGLDDENFRGAIAGYEFSEDEIRAAYEEFCGGEA